jgi:diaminohydroxyphosphoribosylaminopyrimidine deaminase/5-amino-6-(5-phosphoribosylamino)uracil reductase
MKPDTQDRQAMTAALEQARKGMFTTTPNPRVGCILMKDGIIIGRGYTQPPGGNHAEIQALEDARAQGHDPKGATAYVTLEPCSHFGRTPPCANRLVQEGIARVVSAMTDPNPQVAGKGLAILEAAGIAVDNGLLQDEAYEVNIGFFQRMLHGTPWVRLKTAVSLDNKTALHNGVSQWITGPAARDDGHAWRARACAILTGIGTIKDDDPQLNVRAVDTPRQPRRIVLDSRLEIDPAAKVLSGGGTWIVTASNDRDKIARLESTGAEIIYLPNTDGGIDLPALMQELGRRQINELHVEAGARLNTALIAAGCVHELLLYVAPVLLGDARQMFNLPALETLEGALRLQFHEVRQVGDDLRILARFN